jgi:wyosine [tRNA(Phe)-imidazoG37] synthetase (radical SAM superfamily)
MIRKVKDLTQIPVAVITNGSLLHLAEVRDDLAQADAVLPSLDAASAELYRKINRPDPAIPLELHLRGLIEFRHEYDGAYWPEVMLLRDLNDSEHALAELGAQLRNLAPDEVHLNTPSRPAAEDWVKPADEEGLLRAKALLGEVVRVVLPAGGTFDLGGNEGVVDALIAILSRHPMREEELRQTLAAWAPDEITSALAQLAACGQAQIITRYGTRFWSAAAAFYPDACS